MGDMMCTRLPYISTNIIRKNVDNGLMSGGFSVNIHICLVQKMCGSA